MSINKFNVSYADFELGQIINPEEFDVNNADIVTRINLIIDVLNQITDGINGLGQPADGTAIIDSGTISPFTSGKLQPLLEEIITRLRSVVDSTSGADFIGLTPVSGWNSDTVQSQFEELKTITDQMTADRVSGDNNLQSQITTLNATVTSHGSRLTTAESNITALQSSKADSSSVYTKAQSDSNLATLDSNLRLDFYSKSQVDTLLSGKTSNTGNHAGTWQGLDVDDLAGAIGAQGCVISNTQPTSPTEQLLWFNPSNNQYAIYLNGQWRINSAPTQIGKRHNRVTLGSAVSTVNIGISGFNPLYDAFFVTQNSVFINEGYEYSVGGDGVSITKLGGGTWDVGTVFDFMAFVVQPAT